MQKYVSESEPTNCAHCNRKLDESNLNHLRGYDPFNYEDWICFDCEKESN